MDEPQEDAETVDLAEEDGCKDVAQETDLPIEDLGLEKVAYVAPIETADNAAPLAIKRRMRFRFESESATTLSKIGNE